MKTFPLYLTALVLAAACARESSEQTAASNAGTAGGLTGRALCDSIADRGLAVDVATRATLLGALGAPDSVKVAVEPNRHDPAARDSIVTVFHGGLTGQFRKPGSGGDLHERITVRDNRFLRFPAAGIGVSSADLKTALGPPAEESDSTLTYQCSALDVGPQPLIFRLSNGAVQSVEINYYVD